MCTFGRRVLEKLAYSLRYFISLIIPVSPTTHLYTIPHSSDLILQIFSKMSKSVFDFLRLMKVSCSKSYNSNHATFTLGNATLCLCLFISCHLFLHYNNVLKSLETISCWLCLNTFSSRQLLFENSTFMSKGER